MTDKVSVVIPTYNRFNYLLNTIKSIEQQTYKNIELIIVNDCSTDNAYYIYDWTKRNIIIKHLESNTKNRFGYACAGFVRNKGIELATGKYIAFCDDDDIWLPNKIEQQIKYMNESGCKFSCTEGLLGNGIYNLNKKYKKYNSEANIETLQKIYNIHSSEFLKNGFPTIWNLDFLKIHNCVVCSSVLVEKNILNQINNFKNLKNGKEDYDCWLRLLENTNCVYVNIPLFYYDLNHGSGRNY